MSQTCAEPYSGAECTAAVQLDVDWLAPQHDACHVRQDEGEKEEEEEEEVEISDSSSNSGDDEEDYEEERRPARRRARRGSEAPSRQKGSSPPANRCRLVPTCCRLLGSCLMTAGRDNSYRSAERRATFLCAQANAAGGHWNEPAAQRGCSLQLHRSEDDREDGAEGSQQERCMIRNRVYGMHQCPLGGVHSCGRCTHKPLLTMHAVLTSYRAWQSQPQHVPQCTAQGHAAAACAAFEAAGFASALTKRSLTFLSATAGGRGGGGGIFSGMM